MKLIDTAIGLTTLLLLLGSPALLGQKLKEPASTAENTGDPFAAQPNADDSSATANALPSGGGGGSFSYGVLTGPSAASPGIGNTLIIRSSTPEPKEQSNLEEDMAVMGLILDKALQEDAGRGGGHSAMGINVLFAPGSGPMKNLYLEGYGVVFFKRVPFPLMASPAKAETENQETSTDSTWEAAKQELYGHPGENQLLGHQPGEEFDEERVSQLRRTLLESLKNATNIRDLKPAESVTVCVTGGASAVAVKSTRTARFAARTSGRGHVAVFGTSPMQGTILTITAKKSDIDAYAKGRLNLEDFTKRTRIATYAGPVDVGTDGLTYSSVGGAGGGGFGGGSGVWSFGPGR